MKINSHIQVPQTFRTDSSNQGYLHRVQGGQGEKEISENSPGAVFANHHLKPLMVPTFSGDKTKFEDFWMLIESLVDQCKEPVNLKMSRLWQCLFGSALENK